jgi:hypothetical protein
MKAIVLFICTLLLCLGEAYAGGVSSSVVFKQRESFVSRQSTVNFATFSTPEERTLFAIGKINALDSTDSEQENLPLKRAVHLRNNGVFMIVFGSILTVGGTFLASYAYHKIDEPKNTQGYTRDTTVERNAIVIGSVIGALGVSVVIPGAVLCQIGKNRIKKYKR